MKSIFRPVLLLCLLLAPLASGAAEPAPPAAGAAPVDDQVVIQATRENLVKLGKEIQQAQYRFYKRYNDLNTKRDYAIKCSNEAPTGTRFKVTTCDPVFVVKAEEEEAREALMSFAGGDQVSGTPGGVTGPRPFGAPPATFPVAQGTFARASAPIAEARPGFKRHMIEVTQKNPELLKMAQEHAEMWSRYDAMYRKLNGRAAPAEKPADSK